MTEDQFYYCLSRILELRAKLAEAQAALRDARIGKPDQTDQGQMDFESLQRYATHKADANLNAAEANALIKELLAQEEKVRSFVPLPLYGTRIEASKQGQPPLYVVVEAHKVDVEKSSL